MKRSLFAAALMLFGASATAQQASWNGSMDSVTTITGAQGVKCGYQYNGQEFSRVFRASDCPRVVDVEVPSSARSTLADCQSIAPSLYQQCIQTAGPTPLSQCSVLPFDLSRVCIRRGGR